MVLMVLLTLGGLFAAQSMSIQGASYGMKLATSGSQRILRGGTTVPAAAVGRWAGNRAMTYGSTVGEDGKSTTNSYAQSMATRLASVKVAGMNVGRFFSGASEKINKKVTFLVKDKILALSLYPFTDLYKILPYDTKEIYNPYKL